VLFNPSFAGADDSRLDVYGSLSFSAGMKNLFTGEVHFLSATSNNSVTSAGQHFLSAVYFDGPGGYWMLSDALYADQGLFLRQGTLHTNSQTVHCGFFDGSGIQARGLITLNSHFIVERTWNTSNAEGLYFPQEGNYSIEFLQRAKDQFQPGSVLYKKVILPASNCPPLTLTTTTTEDSCNVLPCTGTATVNIVGGNGPYTILWTPGGQTTTTATGLCPGSYIVDVTDANGNNCSEVATVTQPAPILINSSFVKPTCFGFCNGSITANPVGGVVPYTYSWSPTNQTTATATGLCAGTYTVTVTDAYRCTKTKIIILQQPTLLIPNGSSVNVLCFGQCTGSVSVNPSGGTPPYSYNWSPTNATTSSISGLCAGTCHTVTITDANGCDTTFSACITQPPQLTGNITTTNNPVPCNGNCNATATINAAGGVPPYSYSWAPGGQTNATATGLCAGTYTVTTTDANGCTRTNTVTITQPTQLTATQSQVNILCNGFCTGTATVNASNATPPYSYSWNTTPAQTTATATGLCAGSYTCTVSDLNNCSIQVTFTLTQPPALQVQSSQTNPLCFNQCNGTATVSVSGGTPNYSYSWNTTPVQTTSTATGLCAGSYTCTITDANNCTTTATFTITTPPQLTSTTSQQNVPCFGFCNGTATVNVSGGTPGYNYSWTPTNQTTQTATGLCAGNYTCVITDANGCTIQRTFTITQPPQLTLSISATSLACNGDCNAIVTTVVGGGTAPYNYSWAPGNQTTPSITGQCAGSYTVTVTDANGCTRTANITINQPTALTLITAVNPCSCFGICNGSASGIAGGGTPPYTYTWSPGNQTTATITGQCAGSYTLTVRDNNGCTAQQVVTITQPTQIQLGMNITNVTCNSNCDGSATTNVSGGTAPYTYSWMPGNFTTTSISNLCPGSYTLTVTDANSCSAQQIFLIQQPPPLNATISQTTTACNICNGTATVTPFGGTPPYTYSWDPTAQTTQTATGLCPGNYTVYITDATGCTTSAVATVTLTVVIQITTSGSTLACFGSGGTACAAPSGGQAPYSYLWQPTNPFQTTQCATGLTAGTYTVIATDANGCTGIDSVTFTNPPQLFASATATNVSCNNACDATATANGVGGTGGYTYSWAPGGQTTQTATGLCAGSYTVTVSDANACTDTAIVNVTQATPITANATVTDANCTLCDGSITINPSGGVPPYTYTWTPGNFTTSTINNLCPGIYQVQVVDAAGCDSTFNVLVSNISGPNVVLNVTDATCTGSCNGIITSTVTGGTPPYTYSWNPNSETTTGISSLCAGTYTVWVADQPGCLTLEQITVNEPQPITWNATVNNSTCAQNCNGSISISPSGGTPGYTFSWSNGATSQNVTGLCAGTYTVQLTDANGCTDTSSFTITQPPVLTVVVSSTNVNCNSACDGTGTATPSGGTGPYSYSWTPGNIVTPTIVGLCPGNYICYITDANGCTISDTITITEPPPLTASLVQTNAMCFGACNGTATVTPGGGTPGYTFSWTTTPSQNTATATGLCAGQYNCYVTDANGCVTIQVVNITQPQQILPNVTTNNASCNSMCNGTATATPSGGSGGPYTYSWMPGGQTTQTATGLCAGNYTVTVTDNNGCTGQQILTITEPTPISANPSVQTQPTCPAVCNGALTANPIGGTPPYSYSWSTGQTTQTATGLCTGNYTITVTDANGCTDQQVFNLPAPNPLTVVWAVGPANCGVCNGSLTANPGGGTAPYLYLWSTGDTTQTVSNLCAGLYSVTVTDAQGCTQQFTVGLSNAIGGLLTMSSTPASCFGICDGSVSVSATGSSPFTYTWFPNSCTTVSCGPLCQGSYTVQVNDSAGCITFDSVQVTQPSQLQDNAVVVNTQCSGICSGSITLNPSGSNGGPYTYVWTPNVSTSNSATGLCTGTYSVTVTAANGCTRSFTYTLTGITVVNVTASNTNISCSGACSATATVTSVTGGAAPYTYLWNDPLGQFTPTATGLCAGTYIVSVKDANGCIGYDTVTVTQTPGISGTFSVTNPSCGLCNGVITATPSGGVPPYNMIWNTSATTSTINGVCAGLYSVQITDANGCSVTLNIPVSNSTNMQSNVTVTNETCFNSCNGTASAAPTGGTAPYTYLWQPGGQTTSSLNNLCAGVYFISVTDAAGCIVTDSVVISGPTQIVTNQAVVNTDCGACIGSITLNPSGGTAPYTFLWSTGATTPVINNLCAGTYTVTITDANGCTQQYVIPITTTNGPSVTVSASSVNCSGTCSGTATPTVTGGNSPYTFSWSTGATTGTLNNLCAGNYWVQVTDASGCTSTAIFTIQQSNPISFSAPIAADPMCNGYNNGSINVVVNGGTIPYTYSWSAPGGSTSSLTGLTAGSYTVYASDANGCSDSLVITLVDPPVLAATNGGVTSSSCNTVADGAISLNVAGGTPSYTFSWVPGNMTTQNVSNILSGNYTVFVTDANGCTDTVQFTVPAAVSVNASITGTDTICLGNCAGLYATTSVNALTYSWYDLPAMSLQGTNDTITVCPGTTGPSFFILIASNGACSDTDTIAVVVNPLPVADAGTDISILTNTSTVIGGNPTGPSGSTYSWYPSNGLNNTTGSNPTASPSVTTTYYVQVTSADGCTSIDSITVSVVPEIVFPNGISPNGDGANDYWIIDNIQLFPDNVVEIYNRWGELLFRGVGYDNNSVKWDGTYKGKPLPVGTYYYIIELHTDLLPEDSRKFTGPITLMR
jgi:gliding motility-associated-like protein